MTKNRTEQWFVRARFPERWYGPVNDDHTGDDGQHRFKCSYIGQPGWLREKWITDRDYLRIPPKSDLPLGLRTSACRLPEDGEMYMDLCGRIRQAIGDYRDAGLDNLYGWRRWIVEAELEAEEPVQEPASANPCIREIVADWLKEHNFDGLCKTENGCGCTLDDLIPCIDGLDGEACQAGYKGPVDKYGETMMYLTREAAEAAEKEQDDE